MYYWSNVHVYTILGSFLPIIYYILYTLSYRRLFKVSYFLPTYLREGAWEVKLQHQFGEYYQSLRGEELDSIRGHYISCYDRDILSGAYQFDVKVMHTCTYQVTCIYNLNIQERGGERERGGGGREGRVGRKEKRYYVCMHYILQTLTDPLIFCSL